MKNKKTINTDDRGCSMLEHLEHLSLAIIGVLLLFCLLSMGVTIIKSAKIVSALEEEQDGSESSVFQHMTVLVTDRDVEVSEGKRIIGGKITIVIPYRDIQYIVYCKDLSGEQFSFQIDDLVLDADELYDGIEVGKTYRISLIEDTLYRYSEVDWASSEEANE